MTAFFSSKFYPFYIIFYIWGRCFCFSVKRHKRQSSNTLSFRFFFQVNNKRKDTKHETFHNHCLGLFYCSRASASVASLSRVGNYCQRDSYPDVGECAWMRDPGNPRIHALARSAPTKRQLTAENAPRPRARGRMAEIAEKCILSNKYKQRAVNPLAC